MKFFGRKIKGPNVEYIVIPRNDGDLIFKAEAVLDFKYMEDRLKPPTPPKVILPGGKTKEDIDDGGFKEEIKQYANKRYAYLMVASLRATEGLEWDTVNIEDPHTWPNYEQELKDSGFTNTEIQLIQIGVANANGMNQTKLEEARARFLASITPPTV